LQYLDLVALHEVDRALNFDTDSVTIIGSIEPYTIKAAGDDKKLYKFIEQRLQKEYNDLVKAYDALPSAQQQKFAGVMNLGRNSAFGSLHDRRNRKKFAYMIATLNAAHEDYDFSHAVKPEDFRRDTMDNVMKTVDITMYNLRPRLYSTGMAYGAFTPCGSPIWNYQMWKLIDEEMGLRDCEFYSFEPGCDPFEGEDGSLWSYHYLFYNEGMKRVCYLYFRGVSNLSNSPEPATSLVSRFKHRLYSEYTTCGGGVFDTGSDEQFLGRHAHQYDHEGKCKACLDNLVIDHPEEEVVDAEDYPSVRDREMSHDYFYDDEDDDSEIEYLRSHTKGRVRALSENIMEKMDI
jgi:AP-1 complex subunit sigma 1/2